MERLKVFEAKTLPVIRYYTEKGKLYKVLLLTEDLHFLLILVLGVISVSM